MRWDRSCWDRPQSPSVGCKLGTICPFHSSCLLYSSSWGLMAFPQASIRWLSSIHTSLKCPGLLESTDHSSLEIPPFMPYLPYVIRWQCRQPTSRNLTVIHVIPSWSHWMRDELHTRNLPILIRVQLLRASFFSAIVDLSFSFCCNSRCVASQWIFVLSRINLCDDVCLLSKGERGDGCSFLMPSLLVIYIWGLLWPDLSEVMEDDAFSDTLPSQLVQCCRTREDSGRLDDTWWH